MNIALIVASGKGTRLGENTPKQFLSILGTPLIVRTVSTFNKHNQIDKIVIVTNEEYISSVKEWVDEYKLNKVEIITKGGETRQASVFNGLKAIKEIVNENDIILIHDCARVLVSEEIITNNIETAIKYNAVTTVISASDTVIKSSGSLVLEETLNREEIYLSQTPQSFKFALIYEAHLIASNKTIPNVTDDAMLARHNGNKVYLVQGDRLNFKVTTKEDLKLLEALLK